MGASTLITVAPTGAESAKVDVPALPVTLEELVATARDCAAVGAAVDPATVRTASIATDCFTRASAITPSS